MKVYMTNTGELFVAREILWADSEELDAIEGATIKIGYNEQPMYLAAYSELNDCLCLLLGQSDLDLCECLGEL
jgi:hypothetical protein